MRNQKSEAIDLASTAFRNSNPNDRIADECAASVQSVGLPQLLSSRAGGL
jgi:hypothetical protein